MILSNILFDLDGTLIDSKNGITRSIQYALAKLDAEVPEASKLEWCIGPPIKGSFSRLLNSVDDKLLDCAVKHFRDRFKSKGIFENSVYEGIPEALDIIKTAGVKIYLATSKPQIFARQILGFHSLSKYFFSIYGSELDGKHSNKGELIENILRSESLAATETIMIGDRHHDIAGGNENGIYTAMVTYGYGSDDDLNEAKPDFIFKVLLPISCRKPGRFSV
jgi:phosphoglycolate phosphatase